ncbi:hypothetical protein IB237_23300 [Agrobacterium sp. AGB01]|uniref:hypothetical protein n=1 Tax=Agrobacterium sp. AGB01 TaxID=2769302 RepID=UPI001785ABFF|nr:hypothetical protein [Agrobacterium sp. AGB01]MBD9390131.1 hypothetical protein [Agrobacterium sp. AGB01]
MPDIYVPAPGKRVPMPYGQPDWPEDGRPVNFASGWEARLVKDGDLVKKVETPVSTGKTGGSK